MKDSIYISIDPGCWKNNNNTIAASRSRLSWHPSESRSDNRASGWHCHGVRHVNTQEITHIGQIGNYNSYNMENAHGCNSNGRGVPDDNYNFSTAKKTIYVLICEPSATCWPNLILHSPFLTTAATQPVWSNHSSRVHRLPFSLYCYTHPHLINPVHHNSRVNGKRKLWQKPEGGGSSWGPLSVLEPNATRSARPTRFVGQTRNLWVTLPVTCVHDQVTSPQLGNS